MRLWSLGRTKLGRVRDTRILGRIIENVSRQGDLNLVIFKSREVPEIRLLLLRLWHVENPTGGTHSFRLLLIREANTGI